MALDRISICNEALAELPADFINDFDEESLEAEWCARLYPSALAYLLEMHDWKFPVTRSALAPITNDRAGEWAFAYRIPGNVASELRVFPSYESPSLAVLPLLAGQRLGPTVAYFFPANIMAYSYLLSGDTLYTNVQEAVLEFIRNDVSESLFPAMFTRALSLELASRVVMPILKKSLRQRELIAMAGVARDRAIADSRNSDPMESRYDIFENETQLAREGFGGWYGGFWQTR